MATSIPPGETSPGMRLMEDLPCEGTIRVHYPDNTYKTVPLRCDSTVADVICWLCRRVGVSGIQADPASQELVIITPAASASLRVRKLLREDKPLQIQRDSAGSRGSSMINFKFVLQDSKAAREKSPTSEGPSSSSQTPASSGEEAAGAAAAFAVALTDPLRKSTLEILSEGGTNEWHHCSVILDQEHLWYSLPAQKSSGKAVGGGMSSIPLADIDQVQPSPGNDRRCFQITARNQVLTLRAKRESDKEIWALAIVNQTAMIKERDTMIQADQILSKMELKRSSQQSSLAASFAELRTLMSGQLSTQPATAAMTAAAAAAATARALARQLFLDFAVGQEGASRRRRRRREREEAEARKAGREGRASKASKGEGEEEEEEEEKEEAGGERKSEAVEGGEDEDQDQEDKDKDEDERRAEEDASDEGVDDIWPPNLSLKEFVDVLKTQCPEAVDSISACSVLEREAEQPATHAMSAEEIWNFASDTLFDRFLENPHIQCRLCQIAANIM